MAKSTKRGSRPRALKQQRKTADRKARQERR